jgi:hypothetical protein
LIFSFHFLFDFSFHFLFDFFFFFILKKAFKANFNDSFDWNQFMELYYSGKLFEIDDSGKIKKNKR